MPFFIHYLSTLLYAALGFAVAYAAPQLAPGMDQASGYVLGGLVLVGLLLVHVVFLVGGLRRRTTREIAGLKSATEKALEELGAARAQAEAIRQAIEEAERKRQAKQAGKGSLRNFDDVVSEVRVLQQLIQKLSPGDVPDGPIALHPPPSDDAADKQEAPGLDSEPAFVAGDADGQPGRRMLPPVAKGLDHAAVLEIVREGLKCDRVDLVLQPIVRLPQRKHSYYECFSRIHDGKGRIVVPEQYLEVAREAGLIAPIDNMLLFRCVQLVRRVQRAQRNVGFFCNISSHSLDDTPFLRDFIAFMADNTELAPKLVFEFGQADIADMNEEVAYNLHRLGNLGFRFSMDRVTRLDMDYAELARHRFRYLKVEAELILKHVRGEAKDVDLRYFKSMLDRLGIDFIVEKIENERDLVELLDLEIDYGQGYLFGEPRLSRAG